MSLAPKGSGENKEPMMCASRQVVQGRYRFFKPPTAFAVTNEVRFIHNEHPEFAQHALGIVSQSSRKLLGSHYSYPCRSGLGLEEAKRTVIKYLVTQRPKPSVQAHRYLAAQTVRWCHDADISRAARQVGKHE
jgi:hypothetical protein